MRPGLRPFIRLLREASDEAPRNRSAEGERITRRLDRCWRCEVARSGSLIVATEPVAKGRMLGCGGHDELYRISRRVLVSVGKRKRSV